MILNRLDKFTIIIKEISIAIKKLTKKQGEKNQNIEGNMLVIENGHILQSKFKLTVVSQ